MEKQVASILKDLGIPANLDGYRNLKRCVLHLLKSGEEDFRTCALYEDIAAITGSTRNWVERSMRQAIQVGVTRGDCLKWRSLFSYSYSSEKGYPTNSEFIATIVEYLRMQQKEGACS